MVRAKVSTTGPKEAPREEHTEIANKILPGEGAVMAQLSCNVWAMPTLTKAPPRAPPRGQGAETRRGLELSAWAAASHYDLLPEGVWLTVPPMSLSSLPQCLGGGG